MPTSHTMHEKHAHQHAAGCGHISVRHGEHVDYVHDGHLHHVHDGHVDECHLEAAGPNLASCTPDHACGMHPADHAHGPACGHEAIPHADHIDYLVGGHLHHTHGTHCDDHGDLLRA